MKVDERGLLSAYNRFNKGPKYKIAIRLLDILKSDLTIDQLNKLNNYDALTRDERELVKKVIDGYSVLGYNDLERTKVIHSLYNLIL